MTVPSLVRRQVEASNRTKIKKAVGVYDSLMTKLTVQNNLKSNVAIQEWADDDCSNSSDLFKVVKFVSTEDKCKFKTADGVFWDITDIQKPIIALKEADLNDATAQSDTNRAFYMFAEYDGQGILRVTETTYDYTLTADKAKVNESVDRLIAFMKGETTTKLNEIASGNSSGTSTCTTSLCKYSRGLYDNSCGDVPFAQRRNCTYTDDVVLLVFDDNGGVLFSVDKSSGSSNGISMTDYDEQGNQIMVGSNCNLDTSSKEYSCTNYNEYTYINGEQLVTKRVGDTDSTYYTYGSSGKLKEERQCNNASTHCDSIKAYGDDGETMLRDMLDCNFDGSSCANCIDFNPDDDLVCP